jgi:hypothetical protein
MGQYYGYYATRDYTLVDFVSNLAAYMFFFDSWFYWTHRVRACAVAQYQHLVWVPHIHYCLPAQRGLSV